MKKFFQVIPQSINISMIISQPKMVVTQHHDSTVSEGSDKEEVGSALNDRRGELV